MTDRYTSTPSNQIKDRTVIKDDLDATGETTEKVATVQSNGSVDWQFIRSLADYKKLQDNFALIAFKTAIAGSFSIFNMIDGISDYYIDESGIDTVNSLNEDYDATDDYYSPTGAAGLTTSPFAHYKLNDDLATTNVIDNGTGSNDGTCSVNTSTLSVAGKVNDAFDFEHGSSHYVDCDAVMSTIASDSVGSYSFWCKPETNDYAPVAFGDTNSPLTSMWLNAKTTPEVFAKKDGVLQFQGTVGVSLTTGVWYHMVVVQDGTELKVYVDGDEKTITWSVETDKGFWFADTGFNTMKIGAVENSNGIGEYFDGLIDDVRYYRIALTSADVLLLYNSGNGTEDDQPAGTINNMTLISDTFIAEAEATDARIVFLEEDVDAITLNTDLKVYATRDSGANWVQGTLSDEGDYDASKRILVADFTLAGSGTNMEYKLTTLNSKDLKIHASSLNWS